MTQTIPLSPTVSEAIQTSRSDRKAHEKTVAMMVWNTCENDSRVIKEAQTLASAGYAMTVVCLMADHLPAVERHAGVTYQRVPRDHRSLATRVDSALRFILLAVGGVALMAGGWLLGSRGASRVQLAGASLLLFLFLLGSVVTSRRAIAKARSFITRLVLAGVRTSVLGDLYKLANFRLVLLAMGDTVRGLAPSVIHAHDLQTLPAAAKLARELGSKLIYDSHELALEISNPPHGIQRWWMKRHEVRAIRAADGVVTVSEGIANKLQERYACQPPVIIYNSPPTLFAETPGNTVRSDLQLDNSVPLALYVGAPSAHRGMEVLIDALGLLPQLHLACVGPRRPAWEVDLYSRAQLTRSEDRLHFLDPVPIDELLHYLSTATVGVIPYQNVCLNHEYCMPNKLFETILAGVPIVVANLHDLRNFVERHQVGRAADESNPTALAEAIHDVAASDELKPKGHRLARLREEFGWEAQAHRLLALYDGLTRAHANAREVTGTSTPS